VSGGLGGGSASGSSGSNPGGGRERGGAPAGGDEEERGAEAEAEPPPPRSGEFPVASVSVPRRRRRLEAWMVGGEGELAGEAAGGVVGVAVADGLNKAGRAAAGPPAERKWLGWNFLWW